MSNFSSHGRGGAGNMADTTQSPRLQPSDLETPTLKKPVISTGRGGTGNMAPNKDPLETRKRQDVDAVPRRPSSGAQHAGRGGAGNVFKDKAEAERLARKANNDSAVAEDDTESASTDLKGGDKDKDKEAAAKEKSKKHWLLGGKKA
ncbi:unnamed protein product [Clonostachys rosea f. rosea IK726]|uniref:Uncharacterized protein n=2 Tax=Bionectria ochroleuca TaxID=29856 RepID=A0A0B7KEI1_BIOOC|nr:unnamed protein product [Clonostachys rosea f. rosea IK726]